jgi:hypothetical protein
MNAKFFEEQRREMVAAIRAIAAHIAAELGKTALDERVLRAMAKVPRHEFVPVEVQSYAYLDRPLPIGFGKMLRRLFGERREKFHHVKERPLLLDHRVNRDVLERDCSRHLGAFLGLSGRQCEHPKLLCWSSTIARRQLAAALRHLRLAYVGLGSKADMTL